MARWCNKVEEAGFHSFNGIATTFYEHLEKETKENQKRSFRHKKGDSMGNLLTNTHNGWVISLAYFIL